MPGTSSNEKGTGLFEISVMKVTVHCFTPKKQYRWSGTNLKVASSQRIFLFECQNCSSSFCGTLLISPVVNTASARWLMTHQLFTASQRRDEVNQWRWYSSLPAACFFILDFIFLKRCNIFFFLRHVSLIPCLKHVLCKALWRTLLQGATAYR